MKLRFAAIAVASALAFNAHATTTDWSTHDIVEIAAQVTPMGSFSDSYLFSLTGTRNLFSTTVSNNVSNNNGSVLGLTGGMVSLYRDVLGPDVPVGSFAFDGKSGDSSLPFAAVVAGNYYYTVSGIGSGSQGGLYTFSSTAAPVPEPQTFALILGGLAAIGLMIRRRIS